MSEDFNLHHLVRTVADEFPEIADPGVLADTVLGRIEPGDYRAALKTLLRSYVRTTLNADRSVPVPAPSGTVPSQRASGYVTAIRDGARTAWLMSRVHGAHGWKLLRDCDSEDLAAAAQERRDLAASNAATAARYEKLAALLAEHDAATVAELPDDVLQDILDD